MVIVMVIDNFFCSSANNIIASSLLSFTNDDCEIRVNS